ncbi:MAG: non-heme ferritin [Planctomycetes bacterium]|jgi:ferritin|nr:non-heme ferritin [Planctomycetota bacterium]
MLTKNMLDKLNEQIGYEFESSNLYLQMSAWCKAKGLEGSAGFLRKHAEEELSHMFKFFDYLEETGNLPVIPALAKPKADYENLRNVFEETLAHEKFITGKINGLAELALAEKNWATFQFLQWFTAEQHEEEALFNRVLDLVKMIGTDGRGLFLLDKEIGKLKADK